MASTTERCIRRVIATSGSCKITIMIPLTIITRPY